MSEDCLFLNVWTPALDEGKRPVMVWLHGGGFTSGSASSNAYDGARLADRGDVVIVSVNHRLNVFGYTYLDPYGDRYKGSGNAGMLDLVSALTWVKDNISGFGGDPDNVLIFGESGGGWKVTTLMAMDAAKGLFHRAVAQSGPALTLMEAATAAQASAALVEELGLAADSIDAILEMSTEEISAAAQHLAAGGMRVGSRPVIDGVHNLRHPFTPVAPSQSGDVPLLIGSNQTEMSMLIGAGQTELFELTWDALPGALAREIPGIRAEEAIAGYRELHPDIDPPNLFFEATTDNSVFGRGSFELADRKAEQGGAPVYQYYLTWRSPVEGGKWGATHALDIGFVFDNVVKSESMSGVGEEQQALADVMSEAWLAFARSGDPNHDGLPEWPPYDTANRATMVFDTESRVVDDPRARERAMLDAAM
jgi:para-nitrobenzyl esterase